jgi:hypothetical protein
MAGVKQSVTFEIQEDLLRMLESAAKEYGLTDSGKALRCLLDYAAEDGDWDTIFGEVRCLRCGGRPGWTEKEAS